MFFYNVLPVVIILFLVCIVNLIRKYKSKKSINLYRLINIFVYLIEIYIATTGINFLINHRTFIGYRSTFNLISDFILAYTVYHFFISIVLQIWDGVVIDGYIFLKRVVNSLILQIENNPDQINDLLLDIEKKVSKLRMDSFDINQRHLINEIKLNTKRFADEHLRVEEYHFFLEKKILMIDHSIELLNLRWQSSLLLKLLK